MPQKFKLAILAIRNHKKSIPTWYHFEPYGLSNLYFLMAKREHQLFRRQIVSSSFLVKQLLKKSQKEMQILFALFLNVQWPYDLQIEVNQFSSKIDICKSPAKCSNIACILLQPSLCMDHRLQTNLIWPYIKRVPKLSNRRHDRGITRLISLRDQCRAPRTYNLM